MVDIAGINAEINRLNVLLASENMSLRDETTRFTRDYDLVVYLMIAHKDDICFIVGKWKPNELQALAYGHAQLADKRVVEDLKLVFQSHVK